MQPLELLSPAGNADIGKAAISCGADAVYIGAQKFGARKAAGNSPAEIENLIRYAHLYRSKVYIALNTILNDTELAEAETMIRTYHAMGADAVIVQDMGILELSLPPIPLFASTQTNNTSWQKVDFLEKTGFQRVILARELSIDDIKEIRSRTKVDLEFFVHGALCVSYSGQCYFSHTTQGRSGNRGECAQSCRMLYSLTDEEGNTIVKDKYLLSLKDLNLGSRIKELAEAGISSFKIEGRLKDIHTIKNITAHYRRQVDAVIEGKEFTGASSGTVVFDFTPDPERSFNRGFTEYFINGRKKNIYSPDTQKSIGKKLGIVEKMQKDHFTAKLEEPVANGDGICFYDRNRVLQGVRINKAEGDKLYPDQMPDVETGTILYRNSDQAFNRKLEMDRTRRTIGVSFELRDTADGIRLQATDEDGVTAEESIVIEKQPAKKAAEAEQSIRSSLAKTGNTIFAVENISLLFSEPLFLPQSRINDLRRAVLEKVEAKRLETYPVRSVQIVPNNYPYFEKNLDFTGNVFNKKAEAFYKRHGVESIEPALESQMRYGNRVIMITRHCIKFELGLCKKEKSGQSKPLYLHDKNRRYLVEFDCANCVMKIRYPQ